MKTVAAVVLLSAAAAHADDAFNRRMEELRNAAMAERKKLGLDDQKARASYPTPEVTWNSDAPGAIQKVCPGKTVELKIPGKFAPKTSVVVESDAVKVVKEQLTPTLWTATVQVLPNAEPHHVNVFFVAPVSLNGYSVPVLDVDCRYAWKLTTDSGDTLTFNTEPGLGESREIPGRWVGRSGKPLDVKLNVTAERGVRVQRAYTADEMQARSNAMMGAYNSPEMAAINKRFEAVTAKMEGCTKKPQAEMMSCMQALQGEMDKISADRDAASTRASANAAPSVGCDEISAGVVNGVVDGEGKACAGRPQDDTAHVSGSFKPL